MHERIKEIRKRLDLTQQEFASRIGVKRNTVATYEMGRSAPSDAAISLICREFNVSENWLRTGSGEMFFVSHGNALDVLAQEHNLTQCDYILIERFLNLKAEHRKAVMDYVLDVAAALSTSESRYSRFDVDAEVASYRAELEEQQKKGDGSSASDGSGAKMA